MYWNKYGVFASGAFDSIPKSDSPSRTYIVKIYKLGYNISNTLPIKKIKFGANPVIQNWLDDSDFTPIKGSELKLNIINVDNNMPLSTFYTEQEDTFKCVLYTIIDDGINQYNQTLFTGYIVTDECSELKSDVTHEIQLTFTDNLGILKDIDFGYANKMSIKDENDIRQVNANIWTYTDPLTKIKYLIVNSLSGSPVIGNSILIDGTSYIDGNYTINQIEPYGTTGYKFYLNEQLPFDLNSTNTTITYVTITDFSELITLGDCFRISLQATGLLLNAVLGSNLILVDGTDKNDFLTNTLINPDSFRKDDLLSYDSCYDVLDAICSRFQITLFQYCGKWYLIRYQELRNYDNDIIGLEYDQYMKFQTNLSTGITEVLNYGDGDDMEFGVTDLIHRPYKFYSERFSLDLSKNTIKNGEFKLLGKYVFTLAKAITSTSQEYVKYYEWPDWETRLYNEYISPFYGNLTGGVKRNTYIGVKYAEDGTELERYGVQSSYQNYIPSVGGNFIGSGIFDAPTYFAICKSIPVSKNDKINISFDFKNTRNCGGSVRIPILLVNSYQTGINGNIYINYASLRINGSWSSGTFDFNAIGNQWNSVNIFSEPIPFDGNLYIGIPTIGDFDRFGFHNYNDDVWADRATLIKDINIEYYPNVIGKINAKAQIHKTYSGKVIKNTEEKDILVDSTIKGVVSGALFRKNNNYFKIFATQWKDGYIDKAFSLGEVMTRQKMLYLGKSRHKLEGKMFNIILNNKIIGPTKIINAAFFNGLYFVFGKLEIDYKEDIANFTLYEYWGPDDLPYYLLPGKPIGTLVKYKEGILKDRQMVYTLNYV